MDKLKAIGFIFLLHGYCKAAVPRWDGINLDYDIPENTPLGFQIGTISVQETALLGVDIKFQPSYINAVKTGPTQFNLVMDTVFDFETLPVTIVQIQCFMSFVGDPASTMKNFFITVRDVNDNFPEFVGTPYITSIPENGPNGANIFKISARDADRVDIIEYTIESGNEGGNFEIDPITGNIKQIQKLDYERERIIQLDIAATDAYQVKDTKIRPRNRSKQVLIINVIDEQDQPPIFSGLPYIKSIVEELPLETYVITVTAQDGDRGRPRNVTYLFRQPGGLQISSTAEYFKIDQCTGVIAINKSIDRDIPSIKEKGGVFSLTVEAREVIPEQSAEPFNEAVDSSLATVTITVLDIDDNPPRFSSRASIAWIDENTQTDLPVNFYETLIVTDPDNLENGTFELFITIGNDIYGDLYIKPNRSQTESPVVAYVKNSTTFDYEKLKSVNFQISAKSTTSPTKMDTVNVTLQIRDVNDNPPKFNNSDYEARVAENSRKETLVTTMRATDADSENFGRISYSLQGGMDRFYIDPSSGSVYVKCDACIDREKVSGYFLTVVATDGGQLTGVASLAVNIIDMNDNPPLFLKAGYTAYLKENSDRFQEEVILEARDDDEPNNTNSAIVYSVSGQFSEHFSIDSATGSVNVSLPLDIEKFYRAASETIIRINVHASDKGNPVLSRTVILTINLEDVNDNEPYFLNLPQTVQVKENVTRDSIVFQVSTQDDDLFPPNNEVNYRIESGASEKFQISSVSGEITVIGELDRETQGKYSLRISATDRGKPQYTNSSILYVDIGDVNDASPTMSARAYDFEVYENASLSYVVGLVNATDPDLKPHLVYSILPSDTHGGETLARFKYFSESHYPFDVNGTTGTIYVAKDLDRERASLITFTVQVQDLNAELKKPQLDTASVTVKILDVVDSEPKFNPERFYRAVVRDTKGDVTLLKLQDYLTVFDETNDVQYAIDKFTDLANFGGNPPITVGKSGDVATTATIPQNAAGTIKFEARARNSAGLYATATVEIVIVSSSHILDLTLMMPEQDVKAKIEELIVTPFKNFAGINVSVASIERNSLNQLSTDVRIYSMKSESDPISSKELLQYVEDVPSLRVALEKAKVQSVVRPTDPPVIKTDFYLAAGGCALLAIILVATIAGLLMTQRKLRWKLKAASAATERSEAYQRSEAEVLPNTNAFSKGNPLFTPNGHQIKGIGLSMEDQHVYEPYSENRGFESSENGHVLDLLGDDRKQAPTINHQAVGQALMTGRQANGGTAREARHSMAGASNPANGGPTAYTTTEI